MFQTDEKLKATDDSAKLGQEGIVAEKQPKLATVYTATTTNDDAP